MSPDLLALAREIGFNDQVKIDGRTLNVQTEVSGAAQVLIRTVVMEGGAVRLSETRPLPMDARDIAELRAAVEAQHKWAVGVARSGQGG